MINQQINGILENAEKSNKNQKIIKNKSKNQIEIKIKSKTRWGAGPGQGPSGPGAGAGPGLAVGAMGPLVFDNCFFFIFLIFQHCPKCH